MEKISVENRGRPYKALVSEIFFFPNGIVVTFAEDKQLTHLGGKYETVKTRLMQRLTRQKGDITVHYVVRDRVQTSILKTEGWGAVQKFFRDLEQARKEQETRERFTA